MSRFLFLGHGFFLSLVLVLPLLRNAWDLWAQTLVLGGWAFWVSLGGLMVWRRQARFPALDEALRAWGPLWGAILILSLVSMAVSAYPHSAVPGALLDLSTAGFFFLGAGLSSEKRPYYRRALVGAGSLAAGVALVLNGVQSPAVGLAVNPNALAAVALLAWPISVGLGTAARGRKARWGWFAVTGVLVLSIVLSRSFFGLLVLGLQGSLLWFGKGHTNRRWPWAGGAFLLVLVSIGVLLAREDWAKLLGDPDRWSWWRTAVRMILAHPGLGVGPGAFGEAYGLYRAEDWGLNSLYAHNGYLEWIAERGLLGGGLLLLWVGRALVASFKSRGTWEGRCLWSAVLGECLFNGVHIGFSFPAVLWLFALAAGLALPARKEEGKKPAAPRRWGALGTAALFGVGFVFLFTIFRSSQMLERGRWAFFKNDNTGARRWADHGLRWNPRSPELHALRAGVRVRSGDATGAYEDLTEAGRLAPGAAGFRMDRAELALSLGNNDAALEDYTAVNRRLPLFFPAWERRGDLLARVGQTASAGEAYRNGLRALSDARVRAGGENKAVAMDRVQEKLRKLENHAAN